MEKLKIGLIGCGRMMASHAQAVNMVESVEIVAVCDIIPENAQAVAAVLNDPYITDKYETMVDVSTPQRLRERVIYNMEVGKYPKHMRPEERPEEAIRWQMSIGGFLSERIWTLWLLHNFKEEEILKIPYNKMEEGMYT